MEVVGKLKEVLEAAKMQAEAEVKEWSNECVTKAVHSMLEISDEPLPATPELKKNVVEVFTKFERTPVGFFNHVKNTAKLFQPALPKSLSDVKYFHKTSAKVILEAARKHPSKH